jgi:hypothetical protein
VDISASATQSEESTAIASESLQNNDGVDCAVKKSQEIVDTSNDIIIEADHLDESANKKSSKRKGRNKNVVQVGLDEQEFRDA